MKEVCRFIQMDGLTQSSLLLLTFLVLTRSWPICYQTRQLTDGRI